MSVMTFISGVYFPGKETCNIRAVGEAVGKFHAQIKSAPDTLKPNRRYPYLSDVDNEMFESIILDPHKKLSHFPEEYKQILITNRFFLDHTWNKVLAQASKAMESEQGLVHIDIHPHNVIMNNGKLAAFLDFDSLMHAPLKIMIGFSAYKLLRQIVCKKKKKLSRQSTDDLVESYLEGIYKYLPELRSDKKIIGLFALTEICRRIAYILRLNIQENNSEWNHVLAIQISGLKEVEQLFAL